MIGFPGDAGEDVVGEFLFFGGGGSGQGVAVVAFVAVGAGDRQGGELFAGGGGAGPFGAGVAGENEVAFVDDGVVFGIREPMPGTGVGGDVDDDQGVASGWGRPYCRW